MTDNLPELGRAMLSHIDALMPAIERALKAEWKRGNYINGPQFAATVEAFRAELASVGRNAKRQDPEEGLGPKGEHAVAATGGETPHL